MKRLEIFPLDSCERGEDGKGEKGGGSLERKFFSHGRETSKTIVARTSTFHGSSRWSTSFRNKNGRVRVARVGPVSCVDRRCHKRVTGNGKRTAIVALVGKI